MTAPVLHIFKDKQRLAESMASDLLSWLKLRAEGEGVVSIALSGGSTPTMLFREIVARKPEIKWGNVNFYWVDERCVPPDHPESNYGVAEREFLRPLGIPASSLFRIRGEDHPTGEAVRYSDLILDNVSPDMTFPVFDLVLLGMGSDGHTASIFPHEIDKWNEEKLCTVANHPVSGQKRVTFTGHLINAARKVVFMISGEEKSAIATKVIQRTENFSEYPASLVQPHKGELEWYMDRDAAAGLN